MAADRVWAICHYPEPDGDAKGHLGIAAALLSHPFSVANHWVWPPGYHYFLAALLGVGFDAQRVRLLNCGLAALLPILVWRYGERTKGPDAAARLVPTIAGVLCAAIPLVNLLGTSAQPATLFAILVLGTAWAIDTNHFVVAGGTLAVATMVRYEAAGAVGLLVCLRVIGCFPNLVHRLPRTLACACRLPVVVVLPSVVAIGGWLLAHRITEGTWFGFLHELYRYAHVQRQTFQHGDSWTDFLYFPVLQPYYVFGLMLPFFFIGLHRAWRVGSFVPLGIYLFLLASYTFKGALGSARYYESLTPFVCISAAYGAATLGARWRPAVPLAVATVFVHVVWLLVVAGKWTFHA